MKEVRVKGDGAGEESEPFKETSARFINRLEIELTSFVKSPLAPLCQRGVIPPFGKGRLGGISMKCPDNYETLNKSAGATKILQPGWIIPLSSDENQMKSVRGRSPYHK